MSCADSSKRLVLQTEHLSEPAAKWLAERCDLRAVGPAHPDFPALLRGAQALVVRTYTRVDQALLDAAPALRVVGRAGVGLDNIDLAACRRRNVAVVHTPDANTQAVVEYVVALLADALRPRVIVREALSADAWNRLRETTVGTRQMSELTLGVLGLGRVGRRVAQVARAIGMRVLFNDIAQVPAEAAAGLEPVAVQELFAQSDVISLHIDGRPSNRAFVDQGLIDRMKPDVLLINTCRGMVIDEAALAAFLARHPTALAMLDVHEPEPFGPRYPLLGLPNTRLYPHLASRTDTAMNNMSWVVRDVMAVLDGRPPSFPASDVPVEGAS